MKQLNQQLLESIQQFVADAAQNANKEEDYYLPYAVKRPKTVLVVNKHFLLQWPIELVDTECKLLKKMVRKCPSDSKLLDGSWKKLLIPDEEFLFECDEDEPTEEEINNMSVDGSGTIYYQHGGKSERSGFNCAYHDLFTHVCTMQPYFRVYENPQTKSAALLVLEEGGKPLGVLANRL